MQVTYVMQNYILICRFCQIPRMYDHRYFISPLWRPKAKHIFQINSHPQLQVQHEQSQNRNDR